MNIHQARWLTYSRENTLESGMMEVFAAKYGFAEIIKKPTRGKYLLDLFITDFTGFFLTDILPSISDHKCTRMSICTHLFEYTASKKINWNFGCC